MELRVLGAHNLESRDTRMECHLIDGVLALDAGGLTRSLSFEEQYGIRAIILSHRHYDHVKDLLPLGIAMRDSGVTVDIYGIEDTLNSVRERLLDGLLFPDFLKSPSPECPTFRLQTVEVYKEFRVLDYTAVAIPVPHSVPAAGFQISDGTVRLFYTGDTGRGLAEQWRHVSPDVLLTEVTFGNENETHADLVGHLTPKLLHDCLESLKEARGSYPRVLVSHINPPWEAAVRSELKDLTQKIGHEILVTEADMTIRL